MTPPGLPAWRRFSIEHLWCLTVLAGVFVFLSTHPIRPHDFWWHIAAGREIVATGQIPTVDTFSFTVPGRPFNYQVYWLMEMALYLVYSLGGPALVILAHTLTITAAYGLLLWLCWQLAGDWRAAALATLFAAALGFNDWNVRPQAITFPAAALYLWAIYRYRRRPAWRWLAVFPLATLVWVNSHSSFFIGLFLLGLWLADEAWQAGKAWWLNTGPADLRRLLPPGMALALSALAALVNPQGPGILSYLNFMAGNPVIQNLVPEWMPPSFQTLHGSLFLIGLLVTAALLALSPRRPGFFQMITFLAFALLGLRTARGIVWFGIVMAPILAEHWPALADQVSTLRLSGRGASPPGSAAGRQSPDPRSTLLNYVMAGAILVGVIVSLPLFKSWLPLSPEKTGLISPETPVEATHFLLREHPPGPLFHNLTFGSYLIWAAQPTYPVFVDPRVDLYPAEIWLHYLEISNAYCNWEQRLEGYGVRTLMLSPQEQPALVQAAQASPRWRQIYQDRQALIFVRQP